MAPVYVWPFLLPSDPIVLNPMLGLHQSWHDILRSARLVVRLVGHETGLLPYLFRFLMEGNQFPALTGMNGGLEVPFVTYSWCTGDDFCLLPRYQGALCCSKELLYPISFRRWDYLEDLRTALEPSILPTQQ